jgi:hypothetical protein
LPSGAAGQQRAALPPARLESGFFVFDSEVSMSTTPEPSPNPGDEALPGTPGTGEDICPQCSGSGKLADGRSCPMCGGTGRIVEGIGGG